VNRQTERALDGLLHRGDGACLNSEQCSGTGAVAGPRFAAEPGTVLPSSAAR
jgi:hypothetical protein